MVGGFSLVEVVLALAILGFCLLTLIGLMSEGVTTYHGADSQSTMVNLATMVERDLEATPPGTTTQPTQTSPRYGFSIPAAGGTASGSTPQTVYVDISGTATGAVGIAPTSGSIYRISLFFAPPPLAGERMATQVRIMITYPANADSTPTSIATHYTDIFQTMVTLNRN